MSRYLPPLDFKDPHVQEKYLEHEYSKKQRDTEIGFIGKIFGSGSNSLINISGLILLISVIAIILFSIYGPETDYFTRKDFFQYFLSLVTLIFGYIFGKGKNEDD